MLYRLSAERGGCKEAALGSSLPVLVLKNILIEVV